MDAKACHMTASKPASDRRGVALTEGSKNNLNFLRLLFASAVIISHVPEFRDRNRSHEELTQLVGRISLGELAVDSFFGLSG